VIAQRTNRLKFTPDSSRAYVAQEGANDIAISI
jgi:hypothetical protein